jgi:hypothetical protein
MQLYQRTPDVAIEVLKSRPATPAEIAGGGYQHPARWHGAAARERHVSTGRCRIHPEMPVVSRRERRRKAERPIGRRARDAHQRQSRAYHWQLLALCDHRV